jgi:predicted acetyltransferase
MPLPDSLQYRFAAAHEIDDVARMVAHSFPGATRTPAWWHEQLADPIYGGGHSTLLLGLDRGSIVAALQLHPLRQWISGELFPVAGVGTVAISPTHRKRGLGGALVEAGLRVAASRGDLASALYPFRTSFYGRQGYGVAGEALQYLAPPSTLPDSHERLRVELIESDDTRNEVYALYNAWAQTQTGMLERSQRAWSHILTHQDRALVAYRARSGALEGYAVVAYRTDLPRETRFLEVEEMAWLGPEARLGLYGWLHSLGDQWERVLVRSLPSQRFADYIQEPRLPYGFAPAWGLWASAATLMMGPMFRLLDVEGAFEKRRVNDGRMKIALEVQDAQLEKNAGHWILSCDAGHATVTRSGSAPVTLALDISTLSRIFIGALPPTQALAAGLMTCDRPDLLPQIDALLALPQPWTFDRF